MSIMVFRMEQLTRVEDGLQLQAVRLDRLDTLGSRLKVVEEEHQQGPDLILSMIVVWLPI